MFLVMAPASSGCRQKYEHDCGWLRCDVFFKKKAHLVYTILYLLYFLTSFGIRWAVTWIQTEMSLSVASPLSSIVAALADPNPDYVAAAANIIRGHCHDDEASCEASRVAYTERGAISALLAALTEHLEHVGVQKEACWALRWIGKALSLDNPVLDVAGMRFR